MKKIAHYTSSFRVLGGIESHIQNVVENVKEYDITLLIDRGYTILNNGKLGPFGIVALLLSLAIPLAISGILFGPNNRNATSRTRISSPPLILSKSNNVKSKFIIFPYTKINKKAPEIYRGSKK